MAEGLAKKLLAERLKCHVEDLVDSGVSVLSSGTWGIEGACSAPEAVDVCKKRGINISNTRSRPLSVELANRSDIIYAMTERHREMVISLVPSAGQKTLLLDPTGEDIADPVGGPVKAYETCLGRLETLIEDRLDEMIEGLPPSQGDGPRQNYREES